MTSADRLQRQKRIRLFNQTQVIGTALIPLTALSIYLIYGPHLFSAAVWPWMRFSVMMAVLTCLWTYTFWFARDAGRKEDVSNLSEVLGQNPLFFSVVIPFDVLLMYPGTKVLGIYSDSRIYFLLIVLEIVHGFGFYLIQRGIQKYLHDLTSG